VGKEKSDALILHGRGVCWQKGASFCIGGADGTTLLKGFKKVLQFQKSGFPAYSFGHRNQTKGAVFRGQVIEGEIKEYSPRDLESRNSIKISLICCQLSRWLPKGGKKRYLADR